MVALWEAEDTRGSSMRWGMESTGQVKGLEDDHRNGKRLAIRGSFGKTSKG